MKYEVSYVVYVNGLDCSKTMHFDNEYVALDYMDFYHSKGYDVALERISVIERKTLIAWKA